MIKQLRPYQQASIDAIHSALKRGVTKMALILPTGSGKTFTAVKAVKDMGRILFICHTEEIITQGAEALSNEIGCTVGLIKADVFDINHQVVMASAQTLHRRLNLLSPDSFDVVVADECDLFGALTFTKALDYFTPKLRLGLTATFMRNDNLSLDDIFDEVVYEYSMKDAVFDGYLTKPIVVKLKTSANLDDIHTLAGEFNTKELTAKVNTPERNYSIVNAYKQHGEERQFIAFTVDVQHAIDLCEAFNEKGVKCGYIVGDKDLTPDRKGVLNDFHTGELTGLTNVMVLSVGYNYDDIGVEIMACPTKSKRKYIQQLGRGFRLKSAKFLEKWKQNIIIIDVVDGTTKHQLINTDELDRDVPLEDKLFISDIDRQKIRDAITKREALMNVVNREQDEIFELFPIPKAKRYYSARLNEPATEAQLKSIERFGHDIINNTFTQAQIGEIFAAQIACKQDIDNLTAAGYDTSRSISMGEAKAAFADLMERDKRKLLKRKN